MGPKPEKSRITTLDVPRVTLTTTKPLEYRGELPGETGTPPPVREDLIDEHPLCLHPNGILIYTRRRFL